jgi:hypothetical protein
VVGVFINGHNIRIILEDKKKNRGSKIKKNSTKGSKIKSLNDNMLSELKGE